MTDPVAKRYGFAAPAFVAGIALLYSLFGSLGTFLRIVFIACAAINMIVAIYMARHQELKAKR